MPDDFKQVPLNIERMPNGGFVVTEAPIRDRGDFRIYGPLFASTTIEEATAFITSRLDPKPVADGSVKFLNSADLLHQSGG